MSDPSLLAQLRQLRDQFDVRAHAAANDHNVAPLGSSSYPGGQADAWERAIYLLDAILEAQPPETAPTPLVTRSVILRCPWCQHEWATVHAADEYDFCPSCHGAFSFQKPILAAPTPDPPAETCAECRHAAHQPGRCLNAASDNECACGATVPRPADTPTGLAPLHDVVCEHGTAMDVHCCNCHSGFLFDVQTCVCTFESPGPDFVELLNTAKAHVRGSVLWKRFIEHTPLENDIAVWMADFASDAQRQASASVRREAIEEAQGQRVAIVDQIEREYGDDVWMKVGGAYNVARRMCELLRDQPRVSTNQPSKE